MSTGMTVALCVISAVVSGGGFGAMAFYLGIGYRKRTAEAEIGSAEERAKKIINDAYKTAEAKKKELVVEAREEIQKLRADAEREIKDHQIGRAHV